MGCILTRRVVVGVIFLILTIALLAYRINNIPEYTYKGYHSHNEPGIIDKVSLRYSNIWYLVGLFK